MTKPNSAEIIFVLDRSGSMEAIRSDMIGGFAQFIRQQHDVPGECAVTLVQFDTEYEVVYAGRPLREVPPLTLEPRGGTALLDAIGKAVQTTGQRLARMRENERPSKVIVVIITDGHENSSREYSRAVVADMIKHQREAYNWDFVFLGADITAFDVAQALHINAVAAYQANGIGTRALASSVGAAVAQSRRSGGQLNYGQSLYDAALAKAKKDDEA